MTIVSALIALYYNVVIAWCLYYLFASMTSYLPWQDCDNEWNTCSCADATTNFSSPDPWNGRRPDCCMIKKLLLLLKFDKNTVLNLFCEFIFNVV